jgi:hypothetical protein
VVRPTWEDGIRDALLAGQGGGRVAVGGDGTLQTTAIARYVLPQGTCSPWVIVASPLLGTSAAFTLGTSTAAAIDITMGVGNVGIGPVRVDLPVSGCVYQVPPCGYIDVSAIVSTLPGVDGQWFVGAMPGHSATASPPVLTTPTKTLAAAGGSATFQRPALARAWRPYATVADLSAVTLPAQQTDAGGVEMVDATSATTYYGAANGRGSDRDGWSPMHPAATQITVFNTDAVAARILGVQWLLSLG